MSKVEIIFFGAIAYGLLAIMVGAAIEGLWGML
jgi:hypothetical protein